MILVPRDENVCFRLEMAKNNILASNWISRPKNIILGAIECVHVTLRNISHGMSHRNGFTSSSAHKVEVVKASRGLDRKIS